MQPRGASSFVAFCRRWGHRLAPVLGLVMFVLAAGVLRYELKGHSLRGIVRMMTSLPTQRVLLALALSVSCYALLTGYDALALKFVGCKLRYRRIALASFISYALSNNIGLSPVTGGSVRYRFYSCKGLSASTIMHLVAFCSLTFCLGFLSLGGVLFLFATPPLPVSLGLIGLVLRPLGALFLASVLLYLSWSARKRTGLTIGNFAMPLPSFAVSLAQICIASLELLSAAAIVFVLLPRSMHLPFPQFAALFLVAHIIGIISQVPGGFGVFETVLVTVLQSSVSVSALLGSLLAYRIVYNVLPLLIATCTLGVQELADRNVRVSGCYHFLCRFGPTVERWRMNADGERVGREL